MTAIQQHPVTPEMMAKAGEVGALASIGDIRLVSLQSKLGNLTEEQPSLMRNSVGFGFERNTEKSQLVVLVTLGCDLAYDEQDAERSPVASVQATYGMTYEVPEVDQLEDSKLEAFAYVNGVFNAWPFWRELLHSTLGKMGLSPLVAPTLRVTQTEVAKQ